MRKILSSSVLVIAGMARCACNRYLEYLHILMVQSSLAAFEGEISTEPPFA